MDHRPNHHGTRTRSESKSILEAAIILGVSRQTVWRLLRDRQLEFFTVRGRKKIHLSELRRFKREHTTKRAFQNVSEGYSPSNL